MREVLESQPNLKIKQAEVAGLILEDPDPHSAFRMQPGNGAEELAAERSPLSAQSDQPENGTHFTEDFEQGTENSRRRRVLGIDLRDGRRVGAGAVVLTTGTFLNCLLHYGEHPYPSDTS